MTPEAISAFVAESMRSTWQAQNERYRQARLRRARRLGRPVKGHESEPLPGVRDAADEELG